MIANHIIGKELYSFVSSSSFSFLSEPPSQTHKECNAKATINNNIHQFPKNRFVIRELDCSNAEQVYFIRIRLSRDAQFMSTQLYKSVLHSPCVRTFIAWQQEEECQYDTPVFDPFLEQSNTRNLCHTSSSTPLQIMVGFVIIDTSLVQQSKLCTISWLSVINKWRGLHVGRQLVCFAEIFARALGCTEVEVPVTFTTRMFNRMDYVVTKHCNIKTNKKCYYKILDEAHVHHKEAKRENNVNDNKDICKEIGVEEISNDYMKPLQRTLTPSQRAETLSNVSSNGEGYFGKWFTYEIAEVPQLYLDNRIAFRIIHDDNAKDRRSWNALLLKVTKYNMGGTRLLHSTFAAACRIVAVDVALEQAQESFRRHEEELFSNANKESTFDELEEKLCIATTSSKLHTKRKWSSEIDVASKYDENMITETKKLSESSHYHHHHHHHHHLDHIIGLIAITKEGWIEFLACSPLYQHQGIGSFLLFLGLEWLRVHNVETASLSPLSRRAMSFYSQ